MSDELTHRIIGAAIAVHRELGPGLLESTYEECMALELSLAGLSFERQFACPLFYRSISILKGYRCDFIIEGQVIVELKAVEKIQKLHIAQVMTYLKLSSIGMALLINFNSVPLKQGIHRITLQPRRGRIAQPGESERDLETGRL